MNNKGDSSLAVLIGLTILFLAIVAGAGIFQAHMEASTYNKLTGGNATWFDALWVELRVTRE